MKTFFGIFLMFLSFHLSEECQITDLETERFVVATERFVVVTEIIVVVTERVVEDIAMTAVMVLHQTEGSMINNGNLLRFLNTLDEGAMLGNRLENRQFGPRPMGVAQGTNSIETILA